MKLLLQVHTDVNPCRAGQDAHSTAGWQPEWEVDSPQARLLPANLGHMDLRISLPVSGPQRTSACVYVAIWTCSVPFGVTCPSKHVSSTTACFCRMPLWYSSLSPCIHIYSHSFTASRYGCIRFLSTHIRSELARDSQQGYLVFLPNYSDEVGCLLLCKFHGPACACVHRCVQGWLSSCEPVGVCTETLCSTQGLGARMLRGHMLVSQKQWSKFHFQVLSSPF